MIVRAFITHKQAEQFSDCQDRFDVNIDTKSLAVSDGMGSTWQQKIWAQLLVETFTKRNNWLPTHESIKPLCKTWHQTIDSIIQNMKDTNAPANIIYRNERNLAEGRSAGATFVGIRINGNDWQGSVLGDSCLIERDGSKAKFYTSQDVEEFDSYPDYFDSDELKQGKGTPKDISGTLEKGGYLLLVSDPFSDFLFEHNKQGDVSMYMQQLLKLSSHDEFETLVDEWRKAGMPNDDTTLVIVEPDDSDDFSIEQDKIDDINKLIEEEKKLIEEKKKEEETEKIPDPDSNKKTGSEADTNAIVDEEKQEEQSEKQTESNQLIIPSDNAIEEQKEDEEKRPELIPVEAKAFVDDLLREYKKATEKPFGQIIYYFSEKAVEKAGYSIFKKYNIFNK